MQQRLAKADFILRGILKSGDLKVRNARAGSMEEARVSIPLARADHGRTLTPLSRQNTHTHTHKVMEAMMRKHLRAGELDMAFDVILNINAQQARCGGRPRTYVCMKGERFVNYTHPSLVVWLLARISHPTTTPTTAPTRATTRPPTSCSTW